MHDWQVQWTLHGHRHGYALALGLALALALPAPAGDGREFLIQSWTREDGVPGTTVTAVTQTPDGYLWLGTFGGLGRFDGVRFVSLDLHTRAGVADKSITCLATDQEGNLWIGTSDGHLVRMRGDRPAVFLPPSRQTADRYVQRLTQDRERTLWALNYEKNLSRFAGESFVEISHPAGITALVADETGEVWAATTNQLFRVLAGGLQRVWNGATNRERQISALTAARGGGCWLAESGAVHRFSKGRIQVSWPIAEATAAVLGFLEDREGSLWLGTYGQGVFVLDRDGTVKRLTREQGLPSNLVRCLFEDREGNIWAGLEGRGLARIRRAIFTSYGQAEGLTDETVLCTCEGREGDIWVGTNGDGVFRIHQGRIQRFGAKEGLANQFVWALHQDRAGTVWAGTWGDGLFELSHGTFSKAPQLSSSAVVLALHEDRNGTLWLGQRTGPQRALESLTHGQRRTHPVPGLAPRLEVSCIAETRDGCLWFGTAEDGLLRLQAGQVQSCDAESGLPPGGISALHVDDQGTLWVAVIDTGLAFLENGRFVPLNAPPGLLDENLNQITDDGLGFLWCGTRNGVVRVNKAELRRVGNGQATRFEWCRFTKAEGLPSNVCSGGGLRAGDGRLWFPTLTGTAVVNPRHLLPDQPPPQAMIEGAMISGKVLALPPPSEASSPAPLRIPPGAGPLDLRYTALSFAAPERLRFRYQLVGLDDAPVEAGGARVARYNRLPPGTYEFQVTARTDGGVWNAQPARLTVEMLPHFWEMRWLRALGAFLALAATAAIARVVILRRVERRLSGLERQRALEAERSRISQDLHDDLGTSLMEIKFLSTVAASPARSAAEVKGYLADINNKSLELVKALDEIVWAVNPKNDSLRNLVNYLCLFAQEFLASASLQCRLDVPSGLPELPLNAEQRHTLYLVTKEALANAAKHSAATEVRLRVALTGLRLTLVIEDNGTGFDPNIQKPERNGLGNLKSRMRQLGGHAVIQSEPGRGTRVELELPLR